MKKIFCIINCMVVIVSQTLFAQLPATPATPIGDTLLCQNAPNSVYISGGSANAVSYLWVLIPPTAGTLFEVDSTATVDWDINFYGTAGLVAFAINDSGQTASDTLWINIAPLPYQPAMHTGPAPVCANEGISTYTTSGSNYSTFYQWFITPPQAGSISDTGLTANVAWDSVYSGIAKIFVMGVNACGNGLLVSDTLFINVIQLPLQAATPTANNPICQGTLNSIISTAGATNSTFYQWDFSPPTAIDMILNDSSSAPTVKWDTNYFGLVRCIVYGINSCGIGPASDTLLISINPTVGKPAIPNGMTTVCPGADSSVYTTIGALNALSYQWYILPDTAGVISGTGVSSMVVWNIGFSGIAKIFVRGLNPCGNGVFVSDTLNVTVNPLPLAPSGLTGPAQLCINSPDTVCNINPSAYSNTYQWFLKPATAGSISGMGLTGTIHWNPAFSGVAKVFVKGVNGCGSGPANLDTLYIVVSALPGKPATPTGSTLLCINSVNTTYSTTGNVNSTSYLWYLLPTNAGTITGTTNTCTIDWDSAFSSTAKIFVRGINSCDTGNLASDTLLVHFVSQLAAPSTPVGITTLCQNTQNSIYTTSGPAGPPPNSYHWYTDPASAGTFSDTDSSGTLNLSTFYFGTAKIYVKAVGACEGLASDSLTINISPLPAKPATPVGPVAFCQNPNNTNYTTTGGTYSTTYHWYLLPTTAGTISGTSTVGTIIWNPTFTGPSKVFVRGINACGDGILASDTLVVTIYPKPQTPVITQNLNVLSCDTNIGVHWYNQNGAISGATDQTYTVTANGDYYVIVIINGCRSDTSNIIHITGVAIQSFECKDEINVYPNPVTNELCIEIKGNHVEMVIEILNSNGSLIYKGKIAEKTIIPTEKLAAGIYLIKLDNGKRVEFRKVMKE
ncbi:MAG: T9SS type A sorting domain-containing protein [Bacteroidota bacterium]